MIELNKNDLQCSATSGTVTSVATNQYPQVVQMLLDRLPKGMEFGNSNILRSAEIASQGRKSTKCKVHIIQQVNT